VAENNIKYKSQVLVSFVAVLKFTGGLSRTTFQKAIKSYVTTVTVADKLMVEYAHIREIKSSVAEPRKVLLNHVTVEGEANDFSHW
jgi:hypothetical protein